MNLRLMNARAVPGMEAVFPPGQPYNEFMMIGHEEG